MRDRLLGLLLFLPVPLVLWLFTRAPLGPGVSLGVGTALMLTHRLYARPFSLRRAERRCLWCGAAALDGPAVVVREPLGTTRWRTCAPDHAARVARVLGWARRRSLRLRVGILGTLALFLPAALLAGAGRLGALTPDDAVALFRGGVALTVLPLGLLAARGPAEAGAGESLAAPFPVHIQALIGTRAVLWLFRLMGAAWLLLALLHLGRRAGLL